MENYQIDFGTTLIIGKVADGEFACLTTGNAEKAAERVIHENCAKMIDELMEEGKLSPFVAFVKGPGIIERLTKEAEVKSFTPNIESVKAFIKCLVTHNIDKYEKEYCELPKEIKDYINSLEW